VFGGGGSFQVARIFGIRIGVDASWFLILFVIVWSLTGYYGDIFPEEGGKSFLLAAISGLLFFACILLHELGHAVVAMRNGVGIIGIDLWALGGVAKLERDTDSPGVEFRVAVAGPFVTLVIAAFCFGVGTLVSGTSEALDAGQFDLSSNNEVLAVLGYLTFINALLLVFNLIPAYPMDGGRVARSLAWKITGDRSRATLLAARLGRAFAYLMVAVGVVAIVSGQVFDGVWLCIVGVFLAQASRSAEVHSQITGRIEGLRVADVMDAQPVAIPADLPLDRVAEEFFLRYGYPWFPVVDSHGRLAGLVTRDAVDGVAEAARPGRTAASVMAADAGADGSALRVGVEEPFEVLLGLEALARLGAIMAVDRDGRLRGIVTTERVRRALRPAPAARKGIA
jgi:Zn-dependent protease